MKYFNSRIIILTRSSFVDITVDSNNKYFQQQNKAIYSKNFTQLIYYPIESNKTYFCLENETKFINESSFVNSKLKSIVFSNSLIEICDKAFYSSKELKSLHIPSNVTVIGFESFAFNEQLERVIIESPNITIHEYSFYGCVKLKNILFFGENISILNDAFGKTQISHIKVTEHFKEIQSTNKIETTIDTTIKGVCGNDCFYIIEEENNYTTIVVWGKGEINKFDDKITDFCNEIKMIQIEEGIQHTGNKVFEQFVNLRSVYLPISIKSISDDSFDNCVSLEEIIIDQNNEIFCSIDGIVYSKNCSSLIKFPMGKQIESFTVPSQVNRIENNAFYQCSFLKKHKISRIITFNWFICIW